MPLNILIAAFISFCLGALAFGFWWGFNIAIVVSIVVLYWDKIENWVQAKLTRWERER